MEDKEPVDPQKRTVELLEELLRWAKVTSLPQVKQILLDLLPKDENKIAYQYSDGRGSEEIAKLANADSSTIRDWGKIWIKAGIADPIKVQGGERAKRFFSLKDFGIDVPTPKIKANEKTIEATFTPVESEGNEKNG